MPLLIRTPGELKSALLVTMAVGGLILLMLVLDPRWDSRSVVLTQGAQVGSIVGNRGNPLATASLAGYVGVCALLLNFRGAGRGLATHALATYWPGAQRGPSRVAAAVSCLRWWAPESCSCR